MIPGSGYRLANDVLIEISLHLCQPFVYTTMLNSVGTGTPQIVPLGSLGIPVNACYVGAQLLVVDPVNGNEIVTVSAVDTSLNTITTTFGIFHSANTLISGATWPLQQATDPVFTQAEGLSYLSRAQNEFLSQCPVVYTRSIASASINQIFQSSPSTMIEMERISLSQLAWVGAELSRDGSGLVTAAFPYDVYIYTGQDVTVYECSGDQSFLGCFQILAGATPGGEGYGEGGYGQGGYGGAVNTVTWLQNGPASSTVSASLCIYSRLYEITQQEQAMQERTWRNDTFLPPTGWFEDRAGNYRWGLNAKPQGNFPMNLLWSTRDTDTLSLADGFVVPDCLLLYVKYKALEYFCSKEGVLNSPKMAAYCKLRFDRGVLITNRFFEGEQMGIEAKKNG
jgi:hypothetical protein